jgi:hypothetical protein
MNETPDFEAFLFNLKHRKHFEGFWREADERWLQYADLSVRIPAMFVNVESLEQAYTAYVWDDLNAMRSLLRYSTSQAPEFMLL